VLVDITFPDVVLVDITSYKCFVMFLGLSATRKHDGEATR